MASIGIYAVAHPIWENILGAGYTALIRGHKGEES